MEKMTLNEPKKRTELQKTILFIASTVNLGVIYAAWVGALRIKLKGHWIPNEITAFWIFIISLIIWAIIAIALIRKPKEEVKIK